MKFVVVEKPLPSTSAKQYLFILILAGLLRHPDGMNSYIFHPLSLPYLTCLGKSAGTSLAANAIVDAEKALECIRRGCEAIKAHPAVRDLGLIPVLQIDGARTNTKKQPWSDRSIKGILILVVFHECIFKMTY